MKRAMILMSMLATIVLVQKVVAQEVISFEKLEAEAVEPVARLKTELAVVPVLGIDPPAAGRDLDKKDQPVLTEEDEWSFTFVSRVWSQYIGTNGGVFHDKPVLHTSLTVSHKTGVYFDIWTSVGLESFELNNDFGEEVDLTVGWAGKRLGLNWNFGVSYLALYNLEQMKDDAWWFYAEVRKDFPFGENHKLGPFIRLDYYADMDWSFFKPYVEGGTYYTWAINDKLSFNNRLSLLYDSGVFGFDSGFVGWYKGSLDWKLRDNVTLELPNFKACHPFMDDIREDEVAFGTGIRISF